MCCTNEPRYTNLPATHHDKSKGQITGGIEAYKLAKELERLIAELDRVTTAEFWRAQNLDGPYMEKMKTYHSMQKDLEDTKKRFNDLMAQFGPLWFNI